VSGKPISQRDIDIWRVEAKALIRQMMTEWLKNYLGKRGKDAKSLPKAQY
jgi:hypothetical protein